MKRGAVLGLRLRCLARNISPSKAQIDRAVQWDIAHPFVWNPPDMTPEKAQQIRLDAHLGSGRPAG